MKKSILIIGILVVLTGMGASYGQVRGMKKSAKKMHGKMITIKHSKPALATAWVDSVMKNLDLKQQIAQLMVIRVPLDMDSKAQRNFEQVLRETEVGGVCFFVGTAEKTLPQIKRYQSLSKVPLLVCIDAEWGLGMRLKDCYSFPYNADFGLLPKEMDTLLYDVGKEIGRQCHNMGIHVNFAPVVDVNSNPNNPVIGVRSFSEVPQRVADLGIQYMKGVQSQGVMAVAKHFPGHGDTETDSHFDLPVINHTRAYMDTVDLLPFRRLIEAGVEGVMTAHLQVNALEKRPNHPTSLSESVVNDLLRKELGFKGMVITDGLDMKGVTKYYSDGNESLAALMAGSDILLLPPDVPAAIQKIYEAAIQDKDLSELIEMRCRRVLRAKFYHGCADLQPQKWHVPTVEDSIRCGQLMRGLRLVMAGKIDSIVQDGIEKRAFPGCQVLAMQNGKILFRKAYGRQTYDANSPKVDMNTMYDIASVSKMVSTTLALMKLVETGKVKLDDPLSRYLPYLKRTDKESITIRQAMSHMARLKAFDSYWMTAKDGDDPKESVIKQIVATPLLAKTEYVYSDLGFILLGELVQQVSGQRLDIFVKRHFYEPMGLCHTLYNPLEHGIDSNSIAPTELDKVYRNRLLRGVVHDQNAYALGGVSGHAGVFSTADDLAKILQMLLNGGELDGRRYLKKETIERFNQRYYSNQGCRRGLGFDKPLLHGTGGSACDEATKQSYGHTGFTGTMVWVDPEYDMIYVFLSNRVYPNSSPNRLAQMNIRTQIQSELYKCQPAKANGAGVAKFGN